MYASVTGSLTAHEDLNTLGSSPSPGLKLVKHLLERSHTSERPILPSSELELARRGRIGELTPMASSAKIPPKDK